MCELLAYAPTMPQHVRTERTLGAVGALSLWASGGWAVLGYWDLTFVIVAVVVAGIGAALLWGERAVARRNMRERLAHHRRDPDAI